MEGRFDAFVVNELRTLLSDMEAGRQTPNIVLQEKILAELRRQYERQNKE